MGGGAEPEYYKSRLLASHVDSLSRIVNMQLYRGAQSCQRPAKHSKIASQRQYRVKEGDGFQELRVVIHSVTGETPQTRRETLKKGMLVLIYTLLTRSLTHSQLQNCCGNCRENMKQIPDMNHSHPWNFRQHHPMKLTRDLTRLMVCIFWVFGNGFS